MKYNKQLKNNWIKSIGGRAELKSHTAQMNHKGSLTVYWKRGHGLPWVDQFIPRLLHIQYRTKEIGKVYFNY